MHIHRKSVAAVLVSAALAATVVRAATPPDSTIARVPNPPLPIDQPSLPGDLRAVAVPAPPNLTDFVKDPAAAVVLGKALFWDMQVGSDGVQACASCHFRAGADPRSKNQVSPGLKQQPDADLTYATGAGPNHQLVAANFPLSRLALSNTRGQLDASTDSDDAVSSQGVHFLGDGVDPQGFHVGSANTRRVEPRNTPSVINAVFNIGSSGTAAPRTSSTASTTWANATRTQRSFAPTIRRPRWKCASSS